MAMDFCNRAGKKIKANHGKIHEHQANQNKITLTMKLRKIETNKEREEKIHKRNRTMGIIITIIMLFSTIAFAFMEATTTSPSPGKAKYKNYNFERTDAGWNTKANGQNIITTFLPQDVENISSPAFIPNNFGSTVYFIADTYDERTAVDDISKAIQAQRMQFACLPENSEEDFCKELPLKNCTDASSSSGIIIIQEKNETSIAYSNFCLTINANSSEILKAADRAIFEMYNII